LKDKLSEADEDHLPPLELLALLLSLAWSLISDCDYICCSRWSCKEPHSKERANL